MAILDTILRFSMVGMLLPTLVLMLSRHRRNRTILLGAAFALGLVAYAFCSMPGREEVMPSWFSDGIIYVCVIHAALFWGFAIALFDDHAKIFWRILAAIALLEASYVGDVLTGGAFESYFTGFRIALSILLFVHPIYVALHGRGDDLIEARRSFRLPFVVLAGVYAILQNIVEAVLAEGTDTPIIGLINIGTVWALTLFLIPKLVSFRPEQFFVPVGDAAPPQTPERSRKVEPANRPLYDSLLAHLESDQGYREPGLTITGLAGHLGTQEHRLRRLINQELGYRNFRDFLNSYRLSEVRERLSNPAEVHIPVLTIALEAGFQSLGPFNRAFKEIEGRTPTEFRAKALEASAES